MPKRCRNLILVLGDQLDAQSSAFTDFDPQQDRVAMAELVEEATHVPCHKVRLVAFFSAMRHFRDQLTADGIQVDYTELTTRPSTKDPSSFDQHLQKVVKRLRPERVIVMEPGDYRVQQQLRSSAEELAIPLEERENQRFYCSHARFEEWRSRRKQMVLEHFYREMRGDHQILLDSSGEPEGGAWNFDSENRKSFGRSGPPQSKNPAQFPPDEITSGVIQLVEQRFSDHPGSLDRFDYPVTRQQSLLALRDFVQHRLPDFGQFQDAMWNGSGILFHSRLSQAMNMSLLHPREVVDAAVRAYRQGHVDLASCEGFVRQIVGWREFVRGIYWSEMPGYLEKNALDCDPEQDVPSFFWDGETRMACVSDTMRLLIETAYAHHIQRLMVLGLFAQLFGVSPVRFHEWHLAMYADAIDWVSAPNTIGMSQYGDGGIMATKPYCASGAYIQRMSNYCGKCAFNPKLAVGDQACPFTTLYWDFLDRHHNRLGKNMRMKLQFQNLEKKTAAEMQAIRAQAAAIRSGEFPL